MVVSLCCDECCVFLLVSDEYICVITVLLSQNFLYCANMNTKMEKIQARIPEGVRDHVVKIKEAFNFTWSEFFVECIYAFLSSRKQQIPQFLETKHLELKIRGQQRKLFFFKNAYVRIYKMTEWQYRAYGEVNHEAVADVVGDHMKIYDLFDEKTKKMLAKQAKHFASLADEKGFEDYVSEKYPTQLVERSGVWKKKLR